MRAIAIAAESVLNALSRVLPGDLPAKGLRAERVFEAHALAAVEYGASIEPLGTRVVAEFEFPAQVQIRVALSALDAKQLASALIDAADEIERRQNLTKQ